jgi:site-specific recombinase XerD
VSPQQIERMVCAAAEKAGIQELDEGTGRHKITPHALRHTFATRHLRAGLNIREVQDLLGHANIATTEVYLHVDPTALRDKVQGRNGQAEKIAEALLAKLPDDVRAALAEALQVGGEQ